jgi:hypothetical protein
MKSSSLPGRKSVIKTNDDGGGGGGGGKKAGRLSRRISSKGQSSFSHRSSAGGAGRVQYGPCNQL